MKVFSKVSDWFSKASVRGVAALTFTFAYIGGGIVIGFYGLTHGVDSLELLKELATYFSPWLAVISFLFTEKKE